MDSKPSAADQMYRQISDESKVGQILSTENHFKSQEKLETMLMRNLGGQTKSIMVFSEVAYSEFPRSIRFHTTTITVVVPQANSGGEISEM